MEKVYIGCPVSRIIERGFASTRDGGEKALRICPADVAW
jgi:hypothetical protein